MPYTSSFLLFLVAWADYNLLFYIFLIIITGFLNLFAGFAQDESSTNPDPILANRLQGCHIMNTIELKGSSLFHVGISNLSFPNFRFLIDL